MKMEKMIILQNFIKNNDINEVNSIISSELENNIIIEDDSILKKFINNFFVLIKSIHKTSSNEKYNNLGTENELKNEKVSKNQKVIDIESKSLKEKVLINQNIISPINKGNCTSEPKRLYIYLIYDIVNKY
ncbi:hypothetical protein H8356DRAFT_1274612 [Neocallimastix lanati (nom. inval.)]|uniref:Uncharacterized protein n=1 Tax=Neocallimastix californiae TaxID=1754190 RepID=A0A1Y2AMY1_9FUNG|nr:hypothetical protein H8356DRAFT_1274612 [Neocallimastix sp. JGI-2020a]ORY23577.1 hypothetical protein LY90DRAFT_631023 [Neocallimastix californiae]|eukprot:ORY23577.1 hypothetical protein LY90DRAFT_631023 [Neocallimastix californiae]